MHKDKNTKADQVRVVATVPTTATDSGLAPKDGEKVTKQLDETIHVIDEKNAALTSQDKQKHDQKPVTNQKQGPGNK
jgi:hypothetical protein